MGSRWCWNYTDVIMVPSYISYEGLEGKARGQGGYIKDEFGQDQWACADGNGWAHLEGDYYLTTSGLNLSDGSGLNDSSLGTSNLSNGSW